MVSFSQVTVGRMVGTRKISVYKEARYDRVLEKSKQAVFSEGSPAGEYCLGDASGVAIADHLVIDQPDGKDQHLQWTCLPASE